MKIILYLLFLIPLFCIGFLIGFLKNKFGKKHFRTKDYYFNYVNETNDYADFLNYDGSNKKGDN